MSRKTKDNIQLFFIYLSAALCVCALFFIIIFILGRGLSHVNWQFLSSLYSPSNTESGILPMMIGTVYMVIVSLLIATPISIFSAIYLNEYAKDTALTRIIRFAIDGLVSVPSIVYGLFGFSLFVTIMGLRMSILSGALTLSIMILPILIKTIEEALKTIPNDLREASYGVGASKVQTIFKIIIPSCMGNIVSAIILGMGRVISESAPLILTAGMAYKIPRSIMSGCRTLTTHLYYLASEGIGEDAKTQAYATAAVLVVIIIILNLLTRVIAKKLSKKVGKA